MVCPLVSVVIPNYNYARYLRQAIDSALAQTYPRVEVIVVDDGSRDDSVSVVEGYQQRARLLRQQNCGVANARNRGAQASGGEYLAFLDADDYWLPEKLERQMALFEQDPELGLAHCGVEEFSDQQGALRQRREGMEGWVAHDLALFERAVILGGGSGLLVPRALFEEVGGFDERLSTSADWELFYRLAARRRVGFTPEVLVKYRMHNSNMHANIGVMERDMLFAFGKIFAPQTGKQGSELAHLRRRCYSNLHMTLAGSYFQAGQYLKFARHAAQSLWLSPSKATRLLGYPARRWQRRLEMEGGR